MESEAEPRIASPDRLDDGVVITFEDGKCAFYPASLLRATFSQAREVVETDWAIE
jgi:hypothetical protein